MALAPGTQVGNYRILDRLGAGGMGEVYRARDSRLERDVALKVLPASLETDAVAVERLLREARAAASLDHPNICVVHDVGVGEGRPYLAMELLRGETLRARLERGALSLDELLDGWIQLADALDAAHRAGLVHRDLKPDNVIVTDRGAWKVLDFGLAKPQAGAEVATRAVTGPGVRVGTPAVPLAGAGRGPPGRRAIRSVRARRPDVRDRHRPSIAVIEFTYNVEVDARRARNALDAVQARLLARSAPSISKRAF